MRQRLFTAHAQRSQLHIQSPHLPQQGEVGKARELEHGLPLQLQRQTRQRMAAQIPQHHIQCQHITLPFATGDVLLNLRRHQTTERLQPSRL